MGVQVEAAAAAFEDLALHEAVEAALAIAARGNLLMEEVAPWTAFKRVRPRAACVRVRMAHRAAPDSNSHVTEVECVVVPVRSPG